MPQEALGLIETKGFVGAVEAADARDRDEAPHHRQSIHGLSLLGPAGRGRGVGGAAAAAFSTAGAGAAGAVAVAAAAGFPAARVYSRAPNAGDSHPDEVRIAFDGDDDVGSRIAIE